MFEITAAKVAITGKTVLGEIAVVNFHTKGERISVALAARVVSQTGSTFTFDFKNIPLALRKRNKAALHRFLAASNAEFN